LRLIGYESHPCFGSVLDSSAVRVPRRWTEGEFEPGVDFIRFYFQVSVIVYCLPAFFLLQTYAWKRTTLIDYSTVFMRSVNHDRNSENEASRSLIEIGRSILQRCCASLSLRLRQNTLIVMLVV
jgi:hypothetical protein